MKLVMTVGGASGPLFGTLLLSLGKEIGSTPDRADISAAFRKAVDSVAARGEGAVGRGACGGNRVRVQEINNK